VNATVFLGGGRITGALLAGLRLSGYKPPIIVHDRHASKLRQLRKKYGVITEPDLQRAVAQAHMLIIAVRPDGVVSLLKSIGNLHREAIAVSLAAGIPLSKLRPRLGSQTRWARAMPSPVCRSGRGLTAITFERNMSKAARREILSFFGQLGKVLEIPESAVDAFTVTYSSSHGYHALVTLARAAERLGLDSQTALAAATHALADGILSWRQGNMPLKYLLREAATPGGIAATVMTTMDTSGYPGIVERGLRAGIKRARAKAKKT
jgi:pyrroline-5-carboxylate reductase